MDLKQKLKILVNKLSTGNFDDVIFEATYLNKKHPEQERDYLSKLDLETLEYVTGKINNSKPNPPEVIGRSKDVVPNKPWKDMNDSERKAYYDSKVGITKGNR